MIIHDITRLIVPLYFKKKRTDSITDFRSRLCCRFFFNGKFDLRVPVVFFLAVAAAVYLPVGICQEEFLWKATLNGSDAPGIGASDHVGEAGGEL